MSNTNNLLKIYKNFRDSDILEDCNDSTILAFLYYVKKGNLEGKSFNPNYCKNTEDDVFAARLKDLEKLYVENTLSINSCTYCAPGACPVLIGELMPEKCPGH